VLLNGLQLQSLCSLHLLEDLPEQLGGFPLFVKPEHGYDSVGIDERSLIFNAEDLASRVAKIVDEFGSALVERYVDGREFSVLVAGAKGNMHCFPPVEYRFPKDRQPGHLAATAVAMASAAAAATTAPTTASVASTPEPSPSPNGTESPLLSASPALSSSSSSDTAVPASASTVVTPAIPGGSIGGAAFITFDDKWGANFENRWYLLEGSERETQQGQAQGQTLGDQLMDVAARLYEAFEGEGYARFDIRVDRVTGKLMVLDCNPNASLFYKDECTVDTILRLVDGWSKPRFMRFLIDHAFERQAKFHMGHGYMVKYSDEHGFSLHASRDLAQGDLVYTDEEAPLRLVTRSYAQTNWPPKDLASFDAYAWPVGENVFAIWDAESAKWKPINHSCDPNCWMSGLEVRARRPIARDEELTLDYATFEPSHPEFQCWCQAQLCRKMVRPNEYKEPWFQNRYGQHVSPHILSLIQLQQQQQQKDNGVAAATATATGAALDAQ
jgi:hypothetical protein